MTHDSIPELPYNGTSGWSGSDTSRDRALTEDSDGTTSKRQQRVLDYCEAAGAYGVTASELRAQFGWHHGQASGALSVLHKAGHLNRLKSPQTKRNRQAVYVLPEHVKGREIAPHGRRKPCPCPHCPGHNTEKDTP